MQNLSQNWSDFLFLWVLKTGAHKGPVAVVQGPHSCGSTLSAFDLFLHPRVLQRIWFNNKVGGKK